MEESKELYKFGNLKIVTWPQEEEGHFLYIGDMDRGYALMRGVLKDLASRKDISSLAGSLNAVNPEILHEAIEHNLLPQDIQIALSQARIKELEQEVSAAYLEMVRLRE